MKPTKTKAIKMAMDYLYDGDFKEEWLGDDNNVIIVSHINKAMEIAVEQAKLEVFDDIKKICSDCEEGYNNICISPEDIIKLRKKHLGVRE